MKNIISIQGYKNSGKDETAKFFNYILNTPTCLHIYWIAKLFSFTPITSRWKITRFANNLKEMLAVLINVNVSLFEDRDFKENYYFDFNSYQLIKKSSILPINPITDKQFNRELKKDNLNVALEYTLSIRQLLQFFGTDIMRRFFGDKLWIFSTLSQNNNNIIIADQRFKIENKEVSDSIYNTLIIHIVRDACTVGMHKSEKELTELFKDQKYDILLDNNSTLKDLFYNCKNIIYNNIH